MRIIAPLLSLMILAAAAALADPYGPPHAITDMAPFCASCHASTSLDQMRELPADVAARETIDSKHLNRIRTDPSYKDLNAQDRELLIAAVKWIDQYASVNILSPTQARRNSRIDVTVITRGGAGPVVGVSLVDSPLRFQARPVTSSGFKVVGPALATGPNGKPQARWIEQRYKGSDMGLATVMIEGVKGDALAGRVDETRTTWVLRVPPEPGTYTIVAAFFYGTEKGQPMGTVMSNGLAGPRGGSSGGSGRIMFSEPVKINVK
ncbi:MAG: hypothetical protein D4R81_01460 [Nitrospiraceae bacterium]|nr:MAG: hypothetical protein D4R81_01460 [Nitrospiraceae bacterium]